MIEMRHGQKECEHQQKSAHLERGHRPPELARHSADELTDHAAESLHGREHAHQQTPAADLGGIERGGAWVRIWVDDAGPGVPEGERRTIFQRFSRGTAPVRPGLPKGTGLGLSLVSEHVGLHGGRVWVEDAPGQGARFVVELPAGAP